MKEKQLIKQCKKGDPKAFELLVHQYSPILSAICKRYVGDDANTKDALQECFINIFKGIKTYQATGSFVGWMKRIAVTSSLKEIRKRSKHTLSLSTINDYDKQMNVEEPVVLDKLNLEEVMKIINELPEQYRLVFNLYVVEGYNHKEIGELLGIEESASRTRVSRARKKVQELLLKNQHYYGFTPARKVD